MEVIDAFGLGIFLEVTTVPGRSVHGLALVGASFNSQRHSYRSTFRELILLLTIQTCHLNAAIDNLANGS